MSEREDGLDRLLRQSLLAPSPCPEGSFPYLLRRARQARGQTGADAARQVGVRPSQWSHYECGVFGPTLAVLVRLAAVFGWDDARLGEMARLAAGYPWKTRDEYKSRRRKNARSAKKRFQGATS